jgi:hypothetical protein
MNKEKRRDDFTTNANDAKLCAVPSLAVSQAGAYCRSGDVTSFDLGVRRLKPQLLGDSPRTGQAVEVRSWAGALLMELQAPQERLPRVSLAAPSGATGPGVVVVVGNPAGSEGWRRHDEFQSLSDTPRALACG